MKEKKHVCKINKKLKDKAVDLANELAKKYCVEETRYILVFALTMLNKQEIMENIKVQVVSDVENVINKAKQGLFPGAT
ncbi:MAG: hypothetical protein V3W20_12595 [Candidatus Neomarinimicrobiota bacterium]